MIYFIIALLSISQIVSFYLIFNKIKPFIKPKKVEGVLLKPIPDNITYEDVDKNQTLVRDVIESIKLEEWKVEVKPDFGLGRSYDVNFTSHDGNVKFINKIGLGFGGLEKDPYLRQCHIRSTDGSIVIDREKSPMTNDILIFLWDYIIKYHENENSDRTNSYLQSIKSIGSKLKTLNRSRKLDEIL